MKKKFTNPVCIIWWTDATYATQTNVPTEFPRVNIATGFIIESNDNFTHIATNVLFDEKTRKIIPIDGIFIPRGMLVQFQKAIDLPKYEKN